eukprot:10523048-Lingulodinium_polyedra.AAC.1
MLLPGKRRGTPRCGAAEAGSTGWHGGTAGAPSSGSGCISSRRPSGGSRALSRSGGWSRCFAPSTRPPTSCDFSPG